MDDVLAIRMRLVEVIGKAEGDVEFRQRLAADPAAVLAENDIPANAVEEFSSSIASARRGDDASADDDDVSDPTSCIHTVGCKDFTCFTSTCPNTCFVSILIDAPDA
jgi:hypothetical protein